MAGEWLAATANTNMFTYEIAPVFLMMENEVTYFSNNTHSAQLGQMAKIRQKLSFKKIV